MSLRGWEFHSTITFRTRGTAPPPRTGRRLPRARQSAAIADKTAGCVPVPPPAKTGAAERRHQRGSRRPHGSRPRAGDRIGGETGLRGSVFSSRAPHVLELVEGFPHGFGLVTSSFSRRRRT